MAERRGSPGRTASAARAAARSGTAATKTTKATASTTRATATSSRSKKASPGRSASSAKRGKATEPTAAWPVRAVKGFFGGIARGVGGTFRSIGTGAKDIDPDLRRDGLALVLLALAIAVAATEWFSVSSPGTDAIHLAVAGLLGLMAVAVPVVLGVLAVRIMRRPDQGPATGRICIGFTILTFAVGGFLMLAQGLTPLDAPGAWEALRASGGLVGWLAAYPLSSVMSVAVTIPLLAIAAFFSLLIITATPVRAIPQRLSAIGDRIVGSGADEEAEGDGEDAPAGALRRARKRASEVEGEGEVPFDQPIEREEVDGVEPARPTPRRGPGAPGQCRWMRTPPRIGAPSPSPNRCPPPRSPGSPVNRRRPKPPPRRSP